MMVVSTGFAFAVFHVYALPFQVVPYGKLLTSVSKGGTVFASYLVSNNTKSARYHNYLKYLPPHVSVLNLGCGTQFDLAPKGQSGGWLCATPFCRQTH